LPVAFPPAFVETVEHLLGAEAEAFWKSYEQPRVHGLRLNPLKLPAGTDEPLFSAMRGRFRLEPVPWCPTGFYYPANVRPGKHPWYATGAYYIQEPSAMLPVERLDPKPGDAVLDLAAAPGGKSTQIAGKLAGAGLLVANDVHPERVAVLAENLERAGVANAVVTRADPDRLAGRFSSFFDKILFDAPCSGEGMFRKNPDAVRAWSLPYVRLCAARQRQSLRAAARMIRPGGTLVYSTCTFNEEENERTIELFLSEHPGWRLVSAERLWPHRVRGEGHFVAVLRAPDDGPEGRPGASDKAVRGRKPKSDASLREAWSLAEAMARRAVPGWKPGPGRPVLVGDRLYWMPDMPEKPLPPDWHAGLHVVRPGLWVATMRKNRAEPAHALAMAVRVQDAADVLDLPSDGDEVPKFLRGEPIAASCDAGGRDGGWCLVACDGLPLGWGKRSDGAIKNRFPKPLRLRKYDAAEAADDDADDGPDAADD